MMTFRIFLSISTICLLLAGCAAQDLPSDDFASAVTRNCITDHTDTAQRRACLSRIDAATVR